MEKFCRWQKEHAARSWTDVELAWHDAFELALITEGKVPVAPVQEDLEHTWRSIWSGAWKSLWSSSFKSKDPFTKWLFSSEEPLHALVQSWEGVEGALSSFYTPKQIQRLRVELPKSLWTPLLSQERVQNVLRERIRHFPSSYEALVKSFYHQVKGHRWQADQAMKEIESVLEKNFQKAVFMEGNFTPETWVTHLKSERDRFLRSFNAGVETSKVNSVLLDQVLLTKLRRAANAEEAMEALGATLSPAAAHEGLRSMFRSNSQARDVNVVMAIVSNVVKGAGVVNPTLRVMEQSRLASSAWWERLILDPEVGPAVAWSIQKITHDHLPVSLQQLGGSSSIEIESRRRQAYLAEVVWKTLERHPEWLIEEQRYWIEQAQKPDFQQAMNDEKRLCDGKKAKLEELRSWLQEVWGEGLEKGWAKEGDLTQEKLSDTTEATSVKRHKR